LYDLIKPLEDDVDDLKNFEKETEKDFNTTQTKFQEMERSIEKLASYVKDRTDNVQLAK
jgi:peptidoglycan hydrolase CwlO-like protein